MLCLRIIRRTIHVLMLIVIVARGDDLAVLSTFFGATNPTLWVPHCRWHFPPNCSSYGIACDGSNRVTLIDLSNCNVSGTLPSAWGNLTLLQRLYLYSNQLYGTLPSEWGSMSELRHITLYSNQLTGTLPAEWANMSALAIFSAGSNRLTGSLPPQWSSMRALEIVFANTNLITGTLPLEWGRMSKLRHVHVYTCQLNGTLPAAWSNMTALTDIRLTGNQLTGTLPPEWAKLPRVEIVSLAGNRLSGLLPPEWGNLSMVWLHLHVNQITGTLPPEWANLSALQQLSVYQNQLTGTLPPEWAKLPRVEILSLAGNRLSGSLPPEWGNLTTLRELGVESNQLGGTLPPQWAELRLLRILYGFSNQLTGTLPPEWANMSALESLDLQSNSFCGSVPAEFMTLKAVSAGVLDLRRNGISVSRTSWYAVPPFNRSVLIYPTKRVAYCDFSSSSSLSDSESVNRAALSPTEETSESSSRSLSAGTEVVTRASMSTFSQTEGTSAPSTQLLLPTASLPPSDSLSYVCDADTCGVAAVSTHVAHTVALYPALDVAPVLVTAPLAYDTASKADTVIALRLRCGDYPLPLMVRDVALEHIGLPLAQEALLGGGVYDELLLSLPDDSTLRGGWLPAATLPYRADNVFRFRVVMSCGGNVSVTVMVPVRPKTLPALAASLGVVSSAVQWASVAGASSVGASVGRMAASQRLLLCDSTSAANGGLLGLSVDGEGSAALSYARGAVVGNAAVLATAAVALLCAALLYSTACGVGVRTALLRMALPSSLLPVWMSTLPTAAAALPLLFEQGESLAVLGVLAVSLPFFLLSVLPLCSACLWKLTASCVAELPCQHSAGSSRTLALLRRSVARRWRWEAPSQVEAHRAAWLVLLDYRTLWYPSLEAGVLLSTCALSTVSGMGDAALCRGAGWAMLAVCSVQLCVFLAVRPMTSLASNVHGASCLLLTCAGLALQCVGLSRDMALSASVVTSVLVLQLLVVGLSLFKLLDDAWRYLRSGRRLLAEMLANQTAASGADPDDAGVSSESVLLAEVDAANVAAASMEPCALLLDTPLAQYIDDVITVDSVPSQGRRLLLFEELALLENNDS